MRLADGKMRDRPAKDATSPRHPCDLHFPVGATSVSGLAGAETEVRAASLRDDTLPRGTSDAVALGMTARSFRDLLLFTALAGCSASPDSAPQGATTPPPTGDGTGDAQRAIVEADIIQIADGTLYAMSKAGSVSIVDVSKPGQLKLLGQTQIAGEPFEMYRRGDVLLAMSNGAVTTSGAYAYGTTATDPNASSLVIALDVADPANIHELAAHEVAGEIADSRMVGDVLYLATYENATCYGCGAAPRTLVTTFNVLDPVEMPQVDQASFQSNAPDSYNLAWGMHWKRSIVATDQRLYVGGHADIDPNNYSETTDEGIVDVLDITDPVGHLKPGARLSVGGAILSRWQLDEQDGILRVISQPGAGRTGNGTAMPVIQTFRIESTQSFTPLGRATMTLPMQEGLRSVRFDGNRAYAITYNQTDPLFVIDLSDPAQPKQRGELFMPGFMFYLEPHGDRVIGLGVDRTDPNGSLNVSLFDVSNADNPTMLARAAFATKNISEDYAILNGEVAEDQDRIQKAFHVYDDGLVVVPFTALRSSWSPATCDNTGGGVQLVRWAKDTLEARALLPVPGHPRRAIENASELLAISDSNVRAFSLADTTVAKQTADLVIDTCVPDSTGNSYGDGNGLNGGYEGNDQRNYQYACSAGRGGAGGLVAIGVALAFAVRRRRAVTAA
jgi:hypothetical protein